MVVGGTGMLGAPVARHLKEDGYEVRILARTPEKAKKMFPEGYEIIKGDIFNTEELKAALDGCFGVHISLSGGPLEEDYDKIEHLGAKAVTEAAKEKGVKKITLLSGASTKKENTHFFMVAAKYNAEQAVINSGINYTIFRACWFMESLPKFVSGNRASMIGKQPNPIHWMAADEFAGIVSRSYEMPESDNKTFITYGPDKIKMAEALQRYCDRFHPGLKVSSIPFWLAKLVGKIKKKPEFLNIIRFLQYYETIFEDADTSEFTRVFGELKVTLDDWMDMRNQIR